MKKSIPSSEVSAEDVKAWETDVASADEIITEMLAQYREHDFATCTSPMCVSSGFAFYVDHVAALILENEQGQDGGQEVVIAFMVAMFRRLAAAEPVPAAEKEENENVQQ